MYSNYFEISTVMNQTHFQVTTFAFHIVLLYGYYYIIHGIIYAAPGFLPVATKMSCYECNTFMQHAVLLCVSR